MDDEGPPPKLDVSVVGSSLSTVAKVVSRSVGLVTSSIEVQ